MNAQLHTSKLRSARLVINGKLKQRFSIPFSVKRLYDKSRYLRARHVYDIPVYITWECVRKQNKIEPEQTKQNINPMCDKYFPVAKAFIPIQYNVCDKQNKPNKNNIYNKVMIQYVTYFPVAKALIPI